MIAGLIIEEATKAAGIAVDDIEEGQTDFRRCILFTREEKSQAEVGVGQSWTHGQKKQEACFVPQSEQRQFSRLSM